MCLPSLSNAYVEALIPNVMVLGRRKQTRSYLHRRGVTYFIPLGINQQVGLLMGEPEERRKTPTAFETISTLRRLIIPDKCRENVY